MIMEQNKKVVLLPLKEEDMPEFSQRMQEAFSAAVIETFGSLDDGPIPSDEDIQQSLKASGAEAYQIIYEEQQVGGAVVVINPESQHNSLDFFFISPKQHSHGLGLAAWKAIEEKYPQTHVWETVTPYFEKRNINFYVNKCGFHIVEFFNEHHLDPHYMKDEDDSLPGEEAFFRFEKLMKK